MRILACIVLASIASAAVRGDRAAFVGGTAPLKTGKQGQILDDKQHFIFWRSATEHWKIPYSRITNLEYGQKVGRRVGATIAAGATTLGIMALPMLLSKKKKHYLTVAYIDDGGQNQVAVFELAKGLDRALLPSLEARTGKRVEMQSER